MKKKIELVELLLILLPFIFYLFFSFYDGPVWCVDTEDYVYLTGRREPLYPLFINLIRTFCLEKDFYLNVVVVLQGLLIAYATANSVLYYKKEFKLGCLLSVLIEIIFLSTSLLSRFAAKRGLMYSNCLLSEGITIPLFILFFRYLIDFVLHNSKKSLVITSIYVFLLIFSRKQMYFTIGLLILALLYNGIYNKKYLSYFIKSVLIVLFLVSGTKAIDYVYMNLSQEVTGTHTSDNRFITTMIFYVSDRSDAELINDVEVKELYYLIYDKCNENGFLKNRALEKWSDRVAHFADHYDNIQIDIMWPTFQEHASQKTNTKIEIEMLVDEYNNKVISSLLIKELPKIMKTLVDSFFAGLMITVSADKEIFVFYAIFIYFVFIALLAFNIKNSGLTNMNIFSLLVLISVFSNVFIVSAVIFNQTRYTIYNMPLFYIAGLLMLYNLFINKKKVNSHEEDK